MEDVIKALLSNALQYGGGYIMAALAIAAFSLERKAHMRERDAHLQTITKLLDMSNTSIKADMENAAAIKTLTRVLDSVARRMNCD